MPPLVLPVLLVVVPPVPGEPEEPAGLVDSLVLVVPPLPPVPAPPLEVPHAATLSAVETARPAPSQTMVARRIAHLTLVVEEAAPHCRAPDMVPP
jgi:hypothetical protein